MYHLSALMTENCRYFQLYKQLNILSLENHHNVEKVCPYCNNKNIIKHGKVKSSNSQRFRCQNCLKTFTETFGSPFYRSRKLPTTWQDYLVNMWRDFSISRCSINTNIAHKTSFLWRHKILNYINNFLSLIRPHENVSMLLKVYKANSKDMSLASNESTQYDKHYFSLAFTNKKYISIHPLGKGPFSMHKIPDSFKNLIKNIYSLSLSNSNQLLQYAKKVIPKAKAGCDSFLGIYNVNMGLWFLHFFGVSLKYYSNYLHWFASKYYISTFSLKLDWIHDEEVLYQ